MTRLSVLLSAYACTPGAGSESGKGWNVALAVAEHHDVWVLTRSSNRAAIEAALAAAPVANLRFAYFDLPRWSRWWKRGGRGISTYYYLWQLGSRAAARRLHGEVGFDLAHHVTFARYWAPSGVASLGVPFVWGPVGGGESAPAAFRSRLGARGRALEWLRDAARWAGEHDPLVRGTARKSRVALGTTEASAARMRAIGAREVQARPAVALALEEIERLQRPRGGPERRRPLRQRRPDARMEGVRPGARGVRGGGPPRRGVLAGGRRARVARAWRRWPTRGASATASASWERCRGTGRWTSSRTRRRSCIPACTIPAASCASKRWPRGRRSCAWTWAAQGRW